MKIEYIKISNVMSFKYYADINAAPEIPFADGLNILIGQNGSGKSTALEVLNFILKRVLFLPYNVNQDEYGRQGQLDVAQKRQILRRFDNNSHYRGFRLEPNWNSETAEQKIKFKVRLDEIDKYNLDILEKNKQALETVAGIYSEISAIDFAYPNDNFVVDLSLNHSTKNFTFSVDHNDGGFQYLTNYNYYKDLIEICNREAGTKIDSLQESFTLIGGYRNYNAFTESVSLSEEPLKQIQKLKNNEFSRSANTSDQAEPPIFNLVRLQIAALHMEGVFTKLDEPEAAKKANEAKLLVSINRKLKLVNLSVEITLENKHSWSYSFKFFELSTKKVLADINSLSAGQKSIVHLIFESYGRGNLKGGVVIIDEPEIHLHYQFQYEYLRIIEQLNEEQKSQYILVTHSEALISSDTIDKVKRFALDDTRSTIIKSPNIPATQRTLIKILDNTRATYAFFAKKVLLVEGDTDRYFFKAVFQELKPELSQEIAILDIGGKTNYANWRKFFEAFGLQVYYIGDFDNVFEIEHSGTTIVPAADKASSEQTVIQNKLNALTAVDKTRLSDHYNRLIGDADFLSAPKLLSWRPFIDCAKGFLKCPAKELASHVRANTIGVETKIDALYEDNIFILKAGKLEDYLGTTDKKLDTVVAFCLDLKMWLANTNPLTRELKKIVEVVAR